MECVFHLRRLFWKRWKLALLTMAIMFVILQIGDFLSFLGSQKNFSEMQYRQHIAIKKVISKWENPQHSKLVKDKDGNSISLRGTRMQDMIKYLPNVRGKFECFASKKEIEFLKVNDNYCDCPLDGSDEPGTNACNKGFFYCENSGHRSTAKIASYKVNDGVCDCCDGSDEWEEVAFLDTKHASAGKPLAYRAINCSNRCKKSW